MALGMIDRESHCISSYYSLGSDSERFVVQVLLRCIGLHQQCEWPCLCCHAVICGPITGKSLETLLCGCRAAPAIQQ